MMQKTCKSAEVQLNLSVNGKKQGEPFPGQDYMKRYLAAYMEYGPHVGDEQAAGRGVGEGEQVASRYSQDRNPEGGNRCR